MTDLEKNLSHSRAAYVFCINSLPQPHELKSGKIFKNGLEFSSESQINSILIELGWSFFCRYEACLEKFLKEKNVRLSKKISLQCWLQNNDIIIPEYLSDGIAIYRKLRNILHHDDGASPDGDQDEEIHLLPQHMEKFYKLFIWIGERVEEKANSDNP